MFERQLFQIQKRILQAGLPTIEKTDLKWYVAGGACRSVFANELINDLDIYFETQSDYAKFQVTYFGNTKDIVFNTDSAVSICKNGCKVQLIKKFFGKPEENIKRFDYTICQCAYVPYSRIDKNGIEADLSPGVFEMTENFIEHIALRLLVFNVNGDHPINSLIRSTKFLSKGYKMPAVEFVKLALRINNLKIKNYRDLREELEGIDTILLKDLTDSLIDKKDTEYDFNKCLGLINEYLEKKFKELGANPEGDESF